MAKQVFPGFQRVFCDDTVLRQTLQNLAATIKSFCSPALCRRDVTMRLSFWATPRPSGPSDGTFPRRRTSVSGLGLERPSWTNCPNRHTVQIYAATSTTRGGLYVDIKCAFTKPWTEVLQLLASDWESSGVEALEGSQAGQFARPLPHVRARFLNTSLAYQTLLLCRFLL